MSSTATYTAAMRTRKDTSTSNYIPTAAAQEFYEASSNFVGIVSFPNMSLTNKVITQITLRVESAEAGYGASSAKTVYVRKSAYQTANKTGVTGLAYTGDALGTFTGSFFGNTSTFTFNASTNASLFAALAEYFQTGANTITLYNPSPVKGNVSSYSTNYLQWNAATMTVTYEEGVSEPTTSVASADLGTAITVSTNRLSSSALHTITYSFAGATGTIGTNVGGSVSWTPPLSLASRIPNAVSGVCTITCATILNGTTAGTRSCTLTLKVPASVKPTISSVTRAEAVAGLADQFGTYVRTRSRLAVSITASGAQGSTISSYRSTLCGVTYTDASFTSGYLNTSGSNTLKVTVTDSRGRKATASYTVSVTNYNLPSLTKFTAERCNSDGSAAQADGTKVRVTAAGSVSSVSSHNTITCKISYRLSTASAWTTAVTLTLSGYAVSKTDLLLSPTFDALKSYDLKISLTDYFTTVEQVVSIGTKQVMVDFYKNGTGVAFGKVAETSGKAEFGWPLKLTTPLAVSEGGTGSATAAAACTALGAVKKSGDTMTGSLLITGSGKYYRRVGTLASGQSGSDTLLGMDDPDNKPMAAIRIGSYNRILFRQYSPGAEDFYEAYSLPNTTSGRTDNGSYNILTTKSAVTIAQGGTGATTAKAALKKLGISYAATLPASGEDGQICLVPID